MNLTQNDSLKKVISDTLNVSIDQCYTELIEFHQQTYDSKLLHYHRIS